MKEQIIYNMILLCYLCLLTLLCSCSTKDLEPIGAFQPNISATDSTTDVPSDSIATATDTETIGSTDSVGPTDVPTETGDTTANETTSTDENSTSSTDTVDTSSLLDTNSDSVPDEETDPVNTAKWVGCAVTGTDYPADFFTLWNQITPENAGKWGEIELNRDVMSWESHDAVYAFALEHQVEFTAHTLIWDKQQPEWLDNLPRREQSAEVEEWISEFCTRYPDIKLMNVVMNPYHNPPSYYEALGGNGDTGYDWVIRVFELAKQYCPHAKLFIEEYNALVWETHKTAEVVKVLNDRNLIDSIGVTGNDLEGIGLSALRDNIDTLAAFGLPLYVTGLNIDNANDEIQAKEMSRLFNELYIHPAIRGITFWGYIQRRLWSTNAYLQRADGTHRPALDWLITYLQETGVR